MDYPSEVIQPTFFYTHRAPRRTANTSEQAITPNIYSPRTPNQHIFESTLRSPDAAQEEFQSSLQDNPTASMTSFSNLRMRNEASTQTGSYNISTTTTRTQPHNFIHCHSHYPFPSPTAGTRFRASRPRTEERRQPLQSQQNQPRSTIFRTAQAPSRRRALSYYPSSLLSVRRREEPMVGRQSYRCDNTTERAGTDIRITQQNLDQTAVTQPPNTIRETLDPHRRTARYQESLGLRNSHDVAQIIDSASNAVTISTEPFTGVTAFETVQRNPPYEQHRYRRRSDIAYEHNPDIIFEYRSRRTSLRLNSPKNYKGVPNEVIDMLPVELYSKELTSSFTTCDICLLDYVTNDHFRRLACLHCFHADCIDLWLKSHVACPVCRTPVIDALEQSDLDNLQRETLQKLKYGKYRSEETEGTCSGNYDSMFPVMGYPVTRFPFNLSRTPL